jgi:predicted nucleic acid-binding protein
MLVLDASVALSWCFEDEATPVALAVLDDVAITETLAPSPWPVEIAHVLRQAERRGRVSRAKVADFTSQLAALPVRLIETSTGTVLRDVLEISWTHDLTPYDAIYVELALRTGARLATLDRTMARAARAAGVGVLPA